MNAKFAFAIFILFIAGIAVMEDSPWLAFFLVLVAVDMMD